jgi:hypothetical protein
MSRLFIGLLRTEIRFLERRLLSCVLVGELPLKICLPPLTRRSFTGAPGIGLLTNRSEVDSGKHLRGASSLYNRSLATLYDYSIAIRRCTHQFDLIVTSTGIVVSRARGSSNYKASARSYTI